MVLARLSISDSFDRARLHNGWFICEYGATYSEGQELELRRLR